jgi:uncharacterized protein
VWAAQNDPQVLKAAIPGCESLHQEKDDCYSAVVVAKIGPVRAKFNGRATLSNIQAPERYTISGEGGGVAGLAKGAADVRPGEQGDRTMLHYAVRADVRGKLAQVGSRLLGSTAKKYANDFFAGFNDAVTGKAPVEAPAQPTLRAADDPKSSIRGD